jgi:glutamine cyclotransferase
MTTSTKTRQRPAEIVREYGPFPDADNVAGVTFDGQSIWLAAGSHLQAVDPKSGAEVRRLATPCDAGTAYDGRHFYQLTGSSIQKLDPKTGQVLSVIPAPGEGRDSGLTWAEGKLWVGQYRDRKIHCIDPETGRILKTLESDRFVTGVTFAEGELWHATWEGEESELRQIDRDSGAVQDRLKMPSGTFVSGLESNGADLFFCGGGRSGLVRAVRRPRG